MTAERFEIVIRGAMSPALAGAVDGFDISRIERGETHLVGWISDQSQLHSILMMFRDLNIELRSVNPHPSIG